MSLSDITRDAVLAAIAEFDAIGREKFLERYGFSKARAYFLFHARKSYDSKAIAGAAHGYLGPKARPLRHDEFSGGAATVGRSLRQLEFVVTKTPVREAAPDPLPLILVENEVTVGGHHDDWKDATGVRYHFPNQYINRVQRGRRFVYYRGVRRAGGKSGTPEYFGAGVVGEVYRDPEVPESASKRSWKWFCDIEGYRPFGKAVPFKSGGKYLEDISSNEWQVGVRELPERTYEQILALAEDVSLSPPPGAEWSRQGGKPAVTGTSLLQPIPEPRSRVSREGVVPSGTRRSRFAKQVGDAAEQIVFEFLGKTLPAEQAMTLRWLAREGVTPGWDIQYLDDSGEVVAVEVKGTTASRFPSIDVTANEWAAAKSLGPMYRIFLVARVGVAPVIEEVTDPCHLAEKGQLVADPASWRIRKPAIDGISEEPDALMPAVVDDDVGEV